ncbi:MAG TPA: Rpn family recombination-promoting nuclease/putative transposase [Rickettsia endosymbiont of Pyrocoelia pectoralis]|nr:Rpn family recombination-promoting nuclease/putative transposase [Rickettsia endosymbiont of Pyrocoelia pectoralis]
MAFRLFRYMLNIAEYHRKATKSKKFPFIYPIVYFNSDENYTSSLNLWDLFEDSELVKDTWSNNYRLINLHDIPDEQLKERPWLAPLQILMKYIHKPNIFDKWQEISDYLPIIANSNTGIDYIKSALSYSLTKVKQTDKIELENMLKARLNPKIEEEIMGSIAHHWLQEGIEKGMQLQKIKDMEMLKAEKISMAKEMKKEGVTLEAIIKITKLTKEEIEKLK